MLNPGLIQIFLCYQFFQSSVAMLSGSSDDILNTSSEEALLEMVAKEKNYDISEFFY